MPYKLTSDRVRNALGHHMALTALLIVQLIVYSSLLISSHNIIYIFTANNWMPFFPKQTPLDLSLSAWTPAGFGGSAFHTPGFFLIYFLEILVPDQYIAEILFLFLPFVIASLSMLFVVRKSWSGLFWPVAVSVSLVYAYNWVTFDEIGNLAFLFEYSVAPLIFWFVYNVAANHRGLKRELALAVFLFAGTLFYSFVGLSLLAPAALAGLICGFLSLEDRNWAGLLRYLARLGIALCFYIVISLPFSGPQIVGLVQRGGSAYYSTVGYQIAGSYLAQIGPRDFPQVFSYNISIFSLLGSPNSINLFMFGSALILSIAFLSLFDFKSKIPVISLSLVAITFWILLELVINENPFINTLYSRIPILIAIDGVVPYFTVIGYLEAIIVSVGICGICIFISSRINSIRKFPKYLRSFIVIAVVILLACPFVFAHQNQILTLNTLNQQTYNSGNESYQSTIPNYLINLTHYFSEIRQNSLPFRVLWLPQENWLSGMLTTLSISDQFTAGSLEVNPALYSTFKSAITDLTRGNSDFGSQMGILGFRYIVVLKALTQTGNIQFGQGPDSYISGNPSEFISALGRQDALILQTDNPNYDVFVLQNQSGFIPSTFTLSSNQSTFGSSSDIKILQMTPTNAPSSYSILVNSSGPAMLVFDVNYDPGWTARVLIDGNTFALNNSVARGWANGFLIPGSGLRIVTLTYAPQSTYNDLLLIWIVSSTLAVIFVLSPSPFATIRRIFVRVGT